MKRILQITLQFFIVKGLLIRVNCSGNDFQYGMEYALINDYLTANNLKTCVLLSCDNRQLMDKFKSFNILNGQNNVWYNFCDISKDSNDYETLLMRLSHHIGVVIDLNCPEIVGFLREISKRMYFHRERYWLMFAADVNRTIDVLQKQNVNVDAEISVAIPVGDSEKM